MRQAPVTSSGQAGGPNLARRCLVGCFDIRQREWPFAVAMFAYFFLTVATFWILKPLKKGLFIEYYAASGFDALGWSLSAPQAELVAKVANMGVAAVAVVVFSLLARRLRRQQLTYVFAAFFMAAAVAYLPLIGAPSDLTVWTFYLFGDLYSTVMIATFFAFLNDTVAPDGARRLYGVIGAGGVAGGVFGSTVVAGWIGRIPLASWLGLTVLLGALIIVAAWSAARRSGPAAAAPIVPAADQPSRGTLLSAVEGARLAMVSPYLLSIAAIVGLYELASTILDFMFTTAVMHHLDGDAISHHFSLVFSVTNWVSLAVQLLLTSVVMRRFGMTAALAILPMAMLAGAGAYALLPGLWIGSLLNTADNGLSYSLNQSAKEALYVRTSTDEKYKAKAFIDMFVQRAAKAVAVVLSLALTLTFTDANSIRWLALPVALIVLVWLRAARYAGRVFDPPADVTPLPRPLTTEVRVT